MEGSHHSHVMDRSFLLKDLSLRSQHFFKGWFYQNGKTSDKTLLRFQQLCHGILSIQKMSVVVGFSPTLHTTGIRLNSDESMVTDMWRFFALVI